MVEDDGAEVPTVVVGNQVLSGEGALQTPRPDSLMLQQGLVQSKQHLEGERRKERQERCSYFLKQHDLRRTLPFLYNKECLLNAGHFFRSVLISYRIFSHTFHSG